jgi:hypothetical protein
MQEIRLILCHQTHQIVSEMHIPHFRIPESGCQCRLKRDHNAGLSGHVEWPSWSTPGWETQQLRRHHIGEAQVKRHWDTCHDDSELLSCPPMIVPQLNFVTNLILVMLRSGQCFFSSSKKWLIFQKSRFLWRLRMLYL